MSENIKIPGIRPGFTTETKTFPNHFMLVNNYKGSLLVEIDSYDFSRPTRSFKLRHNVPKLAIPTNYALGIFITPGALRLMERGYYVIENVETLIKMAEDKGFYVPDSIKNRKYTLEDFKNLLIKGDIKEMEKQLTQATRKTARDVIALAREVYSKLSVQMVQLIEQRYKVVLSPINLNE